MSITAHCIIKNEENFILYAIKSVIDYVEQIIIFDTGSNDRTVSIIKGLINKYPAKIIFEEKGLCDKNRHTQLRQEMLDRTNSEWFMILDGDEVWTSRGMEEAVGIMKKQPQLECIIAPFYLCVGDIYHTYNKPGNIELLGKKDFFYPRFLKITRGVGWKGNYNEDVIVDNAGKTFFQKSNSVILSKRYWHLTHLRRSSTDDNDYSSGETRRKKRRLTYSVIGKKIKESLPEVFEQAGDPTLQPLPPYKSLINLLKLFVSRI